MDPSPRYRNRFMQCFLPEFQKECEDYFQELSSSFSDIEYRQRYHVLRHNSRKNPPPLPGPPPAKNIEGWKWRTLRDYQLNEKMELEYKSKKGPKKVIKCSALFNCIAQAHCKAVGHSGMDKTEAECTANYKGVSREAIRFMLQGCQACVVRAPSKNKNPVQPIVSEEIFGQVQIDLVDMQAAPCRYLGQEMKWICHIKDHFSKLSQIYPLPSKEAIQVESALLKWIMAYGPPKVLQSDNGTEFCNQLIELLATRYGFKITHSNPRNPQAQGLVEQGNGVIKARIAKWRAHHERDDWVYAIPDIVRSINYSVHTALPSRKTPAHVVFGRRARAFDFVDDGFGGEIDPPEEEEGDLPDSDEISLVTSESEDGLESEEDSQTREAVPHLDSVDRSVPSPTRDAITAEVQAKQKEKRSEITARDRKAGKTRYFTKGNHVTLRLPSDLIAGIDATRLRCIVLEEVRAGYYRLLCDKGILEGLYRPGNLQMLKGARFSELALDLFNRYRKGQEGTIKLATLIKNSTAARFNKLKCLCRGPCNPGRCNCRKAGKRCSIYCHKSRAQCNNYASVDSSVLQYEEALRIERAESEARMEAMGDTGPLTDEDWDYIDQSTGHLADSQEEASQDSANESEQSELFADDQQSLSDEEVEPEIVHKQKRHKTSSGVWGKRWEYVQVTEEEEEMIPAFSVENGRRKSTRTGR